MLEMARIRWKWLEMAGNGWKWLEMVRNCQKWLEMAGNSQKWLEMEWLGMARNGMARNWLEMEWLEMAIDSSISSALECATVCQWPLPVSATVWQCCECTFVIKYWFQSR